MVTPEAACTIWAGVDGCAFAWAVSWAEVSEFCAVVTWDCAVVIACASLVSVLSRVCAACVTAWLSLASALSRVCSAWVRAWLSLVNVLLWECCTLVRSDCAVVSAEQASRVLDFRVELEHVVPGGSLNRAALTAFCALVTTAWALLIWASAQAVSLASWACALLIWAAAKALSVATWACAFDTAVPCEIVSLASWARAFCTEFCAETMPCFATVMAS